MKWFIAGLDTETNTYSPIPTGLESFREVLIAHGDATSRPLNTCSVQLSAWQREARARGHQVVESLCAVAEPAGLVARSVYESFKNEILQDLRTSMPVDGVLLALHGAMVADGYADVEGDLLQSIRAVVGPTVAVGAELDLHAHLTHAMIAAADVLVAYKEYPHTDIEACASQLFHVVEAAANGELDCTMVVADCRMHGLYRTQEQPMRSFVDQLSELEGRNGIVSISIIHGFPWGDVPEAGTKVLVVADRAHKEHGQALADLLAQELCALRSEMPAQIVTIDEALDAAESSRIRPVVLADTADNPGGGAPGDSTFLLSRILQRKLDGVAFALLWDPVAVRFCQSAGEGATLRLRIGGKCGQTSGEPLDVDARVRKLASNMTQGFGSAEIALGDVAWISVDGVDIVLNTQRTQVFNWDFLVALGIDVHACKAIVVKSTNHFYAAFAAMASEVLFVDSPGALSHHFLRLPRQSSRA